MAKSKVGVLTFHRSFNYGSYWQARCLLSALRAAGHDAELMDHQSAEVEWVEARCLLQPTLPLRSPPSDFGAYKTKGRKLLEAVERLPLSPRFPLLAPEQAPAYDAVVVGSDEVWNFQHPCYGAKPLFFGRDLPAGRLVSYAASFGNHDAAAGMDSFWSDLLRRFDALSVRDANSQALVTAALGTAPPLVVDPVLLHPDAIVTADPGEDGPYAIVYGHGFPDWLAAAMRRWSERTGVRLLSLGYRNDWADEQRLDAGPQAFADLMAGAEAIVSNFFHGCVFALVNAKPWISTPSAYRFNKIRDLAAKLGAGDHIVREDVSDAGLDRRLAEPVSPAITARIAELRERSRAFLGTALG